jgi:acyl-CoA reductase-like NAD-dependent aldehyde dehydrogenase
VTAVISPVDGSVYVRAPHTDDAGLAAALSAASHLAPTWASTGAQERVDAANAIVEALTARRDALAEAVMWSIGRPLAQSDEVGGFAWLSEFYCNELQQRLERLPLPSEGNEQRSLGRVPYGVSLSICAWNYPVAMAAGLIVAPLLAGNPVVFKHAPQAAAVAALLREAIAATGLPNGLVQILDINHAQVAKALASGDIKQLNFIGSEAGGRAVRAAAAGSFISENLELGGKDASYVRADADLSVSARELCWGSYGNAGQSCCSVERIYVHRDVASDFLAAFRAEVDALTVGDPRTDVRVGPVVGAAAAERITALVAAAIRSGARDVAQSRPQLADMPGGAYLAPRLLVDTSHAMSAMQEELFGPVACVMPVASDSEALALMNDSRLGLTGSVWTTDLDTGARLATQIEAGNVYVNRCDYVDDHLPWGGVKNSGLGRMDGCTWYDTLTQTRGLYVRAL